MATIYNTELLKEYLSRFNFINHPLRRKNISQQQPSGYPPAEKRSQPSILTPGTVISGSLHSQTDLVVWGVVNGDIFSEGDIEIRGEVTGNLTGTNIRVFGGRVHGNICAKEHCQVLRGTLEGNLEATYGEIDGMVDGNISTRETLNVHRSSIIRGDIVTRILQIEGEAKLSGRIQMEVSYSDSETDSETGSTTETAPETSSASVLA